MIMEGEEEDDERGDGWDVGRRHVIRRAPGACRSVESRPEAVN